VAGGDSLQLAGDQDRAEPIVVRRGSATHIERRMAAIRGRRVLEQARGTAFRPNVAGESLRTGAANRDQGQQAGGTRL
jgi:hypothetical protein